MWIDFDDKYEVSTDGHIRNKKTKRILHEFSGKDGYLRTQFSGKTRTVHRVIATAFIPNPHNYEQVNHKDGNKHNNSVENLEWCTREENMKHAYKIGLKTSKGENNSHYKLSKSDVEYIRRHYIRGDKQYGAKSLAEKFRVAHQTICAVVYWQNWR